MKAWLLWLALFPSPVQAAESELMTWEDCVSVAMRLNPDLGAARLNRDAGRSGYLGSFSGLLPQLSLSNSYSDSYSAGPTTQRWSAQGALSMRLFDAGRLADIRSSSASYDRASAALRQASTDLRFNLRRAFLQLLFSQEAIEVSRRIAAMRRRGSELVTLRYDSGRESRGNMLRAQAQLLQAEAIPQVMADVKVLMRRRHHLPDYKDDDFSIRNMADIQAALSGTTETFTLLLGIVAAISLLVGGIGIMNIMLVSVSERTREIGLRKAVGAPRRAILAQFLLESAVLSMAGGVAGILLGVTISVVLSTLAGWAAVVTPQALVLAFTFSASVGVVFGFWPARKASLLSPIEALRYE